MKSFDQGKVQRMPKNSQPLLGELQKLIPGSGTGRLTTADEQRGAGLFRDLVLAGGKALGGALQLAAELPWYVSVAGTVEAWSQLTPTRQRNFLGALRSLETEAGRRVCLSIARGLHKVDPAAAGKLLMATLRELHPGEAFDPGNRQMFFSVLVGKNKPWLLQLDLKSMEQKDAEFLALCALECAGTASPPSAIAIIQWARPYRSLDALPEAVQVDLGRRFRKWSSRWQKHLIDEKMPAVITEILQEKLANSERHGTGPQAPAPDLRKLPEPRVDGKEAGEPARKQVSEVAGLLRQIEARFRDLQSDLTAARRQLRQGKTESRPAKAIHGTESAEIDKLRAENAGLTETVRQLRSTMNELAERSFDEAISRKADTDSPMTDPTAQYKSLLTARLRQAIASFQALNRENHPDALPLLLENIFQVLEENGLDLSGIETPPATARRKY
jgi:hypothetical protein